jgi:putative transposase
MTNYRRAAFPGGYYFFTVVTYQRRPFLTDPLARRCLRAAVTEARRAKPFKVVALCLLPEHLHGVWKLPPDDHEFSARWAAIKSGFTHHYLLGGGREGTQSPSREEKRERGVWQRRFWEHQLRDENDLQAHVDYIHYNPVKHALVANVEDWPWSTYHRFIRAGFYRNYAWDKRQKDIAELVGE